MACSLPCNICQFESDDVVLVKSRKFDTCVVPDQADAAYIWNRSRTIPPTGDFSG